MLQPADRDFLLSVLAIPRSPAYAGLQSLADRRLTEELSSIEPRLGSSTARDLALRIAQIPIPTGMWEERTSATKAAEVLSGEIRHLDSDKPSLSRRPDPVHTPRGGGASD